ncbi:hypothetical protein NE235_29370 [Actinoallomurus spadix]|nr:hypothetical protein [Actinoallomurus spadix]MCO5990231.1 hypothetical protein [Actinoallomurus spadix]
MKTRTIVVGALCTGLALAGCSGGSDDKKSGDGATSAPKSGTSSSAAAAPPELPAGYRRIGGSENGLTIGVPKSWKALDFDQLTKAKAELGKNGFPAATVDQVVKTMKQNNAFMAYDPGTARTEHFGNNVNGFCQPGAAPNADQVKAQLGQIGARNVAIENTTAGGRSAVKVTYEQAGTATLETTQYVVPADGGRTCYATLTKKKGTDAPFDAMAPTIQVL